MANLNKVAVVHQETYEIFKKVAPEWIEPIQNDVCPECGSEQMVKEGHCSTCMQCGWSACQI